MKGQYLDNFVDTLNDKKKKQKKRDEWQSCVIVLAMEYQRLLNNGFKNHGFADLPIRVRMVLEIPWWYHFCPWVIWLCREGVMEYGGANMRRDED